MLQSLLAAFFQALVGGIFGFITSIRDKAALRKQGADSATDEARNKEQEVRDKWDEIDANPINVLDELDAHDRTKRVQSGERPTDESGPDST